MIDRVLVPVRWALRRPVVPAVILCVLVWYAAGMVGTHRLPGRVHALGIGAGIVLFGVSLLVLIRRLTAMTPPRPLQPLQPHWETFACLAVVNLMIVNVLAPFLRAISLARGQSAIAQNVFGLAGQLTSRVLVALFVAGTVTVLCVLAIRLYDRAVGRLPGLARAGHLLERGALAAIAGYCLYAIVLTYNGGLDHSPARHHDTEILASYEVEWPLGFVWLWFADLRSWQAPGTIERVLIVPRYDDLVPGRVGPGQSVRVAVRAGFFGIPRIERIQRDPDRDLERIVEDIPAAGVARRRLTDLLGAQGRWPEVVAHVMEHARHYPFDGEYFLPTLGLLRRANRPTEARLIQELIDRNTVAWREKEQRRLGATAAREATLASLPAEALEVAADVVTLSGLGRALEHESRHADERQRRWYWYVKEPDRVAAAIRRAYRREALVETATRHIATRLGEPAAGEAVAWLRSPFSRRVLEIENEADSPGRQEELQELLSGLPDAPPDPGRVALLARLGRAVGLTYLEVASYDTMARDFQRTTWKLLTPAGRSWANQLTPSLDGRLSRVEWTAFQTMVTLLMTYRPLSDAELEELVRFSESPAGAWAARAFREGLLGALDAARERADGALHGSRR